MTSATDEPGAVDPRHRARRWGCIALSVLAGLSLFVAIVASWANRTLFDSKEFADRSVVILKSAAARHALSVELADRIVAADPSLVAYHSGLVDLVDGVVGTPGFQAIFHAAVEQAHRVVVSRHADRAALELGETLGLLAGSGDVSNQDLIAKLPAAGTSLLIDAAPVLRRLDPWRIGEEVRWVDRVAWIVALVAAVGALVLSHDRRRTLHHLGFGMVGAGLGVVLVTRLAPESVASRIDDPDLAQAVHSAASRFVGDLSAFGLWIVAIGAVVAAAATAAGPPHLVRDVRRLGTWLDRLAEAGRARQTRRSVSRSPSPVRLLIAYRETLLPVLLLGLGAVLAYVGLVLAFAGLLGPVTRRSEAEVSSAGARRRGAEHAVVGRGECRGDRARCASGWSPRWRTPAPTPGRRPSWCATARRRCAIAGSTRWSSPARTTPWPRPTIRAGSSPRTSSACPPSSRAACGPSSSRPTTASRPGSCVGDHELVVTDKAVGDRQRRARGGRRAVTRGRRQGPAAGGHDPSRQSSRSASTSATSTARSGRRSSPTPSARSATSSTATRDEVVMLFIGDYVSPQDTQKAFEDAHLLDRVWNYDYSKPPPTLREMIEAKRNLLVLGEHQGGALPWYTKGYGIFQDTPFTFSSPFAVLVRPQPRPGRRPPLRAEPLHHQRPAAVGGRGQGRQRLRPPHGPGQAVPGRAQAAPEHHRRELLDRG